MSKNLFRRLRLSGLLLTFLFLSISAYALPPRVHHIYISGTTPGANPATSSSMEVGFFIFVHYTYVDPENNPQAGTTINWYYYPSEAGGARTYISSGTNLNITAGLLGRHIAVEVIPRDNTGAVGTAREFRPWAVGSPNPVLGNSTPTCAKAGGGTVSLGNFLDTTTPLCSPRNTTWSVTYTGIDYSSAAGPAVYINWGDGLNTSYTPRLVNNLVTQADTFNLTKQANQTWNVNIPKTYSYPTTGGTSNPSTTVNGICTYNLQTTWGTTALNCTTTSTQTQLFTVWDKENNASLGTFDSRKDPTSGGVEVAGNITQVCVGDRTAVRLQDESDFNCTSVGGIRETFNENNQGRWIQWVYGVAGSNVQTGAGATEKITILGHDYLLSELPVYGKVTYQPALTTAPAPAITDNIQMPTSGTANQDLIVTMRSWNACNQLDVILGDGGMNPTQTAPFNVFDMTSTTSGGRTLPEMRTQFGIGAGAIYANAAPVEMSYTIRLVTQPSPPTAASIDICSGDSRTLTVSPTVMGATYRWYTTMANALANTNVQATAASFTPSNAQAPAGASTNFFVTATLANGCVSTPTTVTLKRRSALSTAGLSISGPPNLCPSSSYTFSVNTPPAPGAPASEATQYRWTVPAGWSVTPASGLGQSVTITTPAATGAGTITVNYEYANNTTAGTKCGVSFTTSPTVRARPTANITPDPLNLCEGATPQLNGNPTIPFGTASVHIWGTDAATILGSTSVQQPNVSASAPPGTYTLSYQVTADFGNSVFCTSVADNSTVNISEATLPANAGPNQDLCILAPLTATLAGSVPTPGTGTWTKFSGPGGAPTFAPNANQRNATVTVATPGVYVFRWTVTNGSCSTFDDVQIDFGTDPGVQNAGTDNVFCGLTGTLAATAPTVGTIAWSQVSGPGTTTFTPTNTINPSITATAYGTYVYRMSVTSGTCTVRTDDVQIIYHQPATANSGSGFTTCVDQAVLAPIALSGLIGGGATAGTGGRWERVTGSGTMQSSGTATGSTVASLTITDSYVPVLADFTAGSVQVRVVAIDPDGAGAANPCGNVNGATITITFDRRPTNVNADSDGNAANNLTCSGSFVLGAATPTNGTGTWSGPGGVTFTAPNSPTSTVNNLPLTGGLPTTTTLTWTVASASGVCAPIVTTVNVTRHPLPTALTITPQLCDDVVGAPLSTAGVDLSTYSASVSNGTVRWYPTSADRTANTNQIVAPVTVTHNQTFFFRATSAAPANCTNDGQTTFTVNALPASQDKTVEFCEDAVNAGVVTGINLTTYEMGATGVTAGGTAATRDVEWYEDNAGALGALIPAGSETNYSITATKTIHAKIIDLTSSVVPKCFDIADLTLRFKRKPINNAITGSSVVCTGNSGIVYQLDPLVNNYGTDHRYTWTVTPGAGSPGPGPVDHQVLIGGGTNSINSFVFIRFPGPNTGTVVITAQEIIDGCAGNVATFNVTVAGAPPPLAFNNPATQACKGSTQSYTLTTANVGSTYNWTVTGGTIIGSATTIGPNVTIAVVWGTSTLPQPNVTVTETSSSGCSGTPASVDVTLNDVPQMSSLPSTTICSGQTPASLLPFTASGVTPNNVNFSWRITNVTSNVTFAGAAIPIFPAAGSTGTGNLTHILTNTSGADGTIIYEVTPTEANPPSPPNCAGNPQTVTVTVRPEPIGVNATTNQCSNIALGYNLTTSGSSVAAANFTIAVNANGLTQVAGTNSVGTSKAATELADDVWQNLGATSVDVIYTVTPFSAAGCAGAPFTITATINPKPIGAAQTTTVCSDALTGITLGTAGGSAPAATYNITVTSNGLAFSGTTASAGNGKLANELADDRWTNTGLLPVDVDYMVSPVTAAGCIGNPVLVRVTIDPEPVGTNSTATRCSDELVNLTLTTNGGSVAAANFDIAVNANGLTFSGTTPSAGAARPANELADDRWTNTGLNPVNVIYTVTPVSASGCGGNPFTVTVTVRPEPVGSNSTATRCSDEVFNIGLTTSVTAVAAATYNITISSGALVFSGTTASGGNGKLANELMDDSWTNTTTLPIDVTYTITPVSLLSCAGDPFTVIVTVNPEPAGTNATTSACSDVALGFNLTTSGTAVAAANYTIGVNPNGLVQTAGTASAGTGKAFNELADDAWRNTGTSPVDVTYTITPFSATGCAGNSFTVIATINPEPVGNNSATTICGNAPVAVNLSTNPGSVAASTYNILVNPNGLTLSAGTPSGGNGKSATEIADDVWGNVGLGPVNVVYTITPVSAGTCLGDAFTVTVTVNPQPVGTNITATRCSDTAVGLALATSGTSVAASSYNITTVDGGLLQSAGTVSAGTGKAANELVDDVWRNTGMLPVNVVYTVRPVSATGCIGDPFTVTVTVNPEPVGVNSTATKCSDEVVGITLTTSAASVATNVYNISVNANGLLLSGGTASAGNGKAANEIADDVWRNTGLNPVNVVYTITPVSADLCEGNNFTVTVTVNPEPVGSNSTASKCSDEVLGINLSTSASAVAAANYTIVVTPNGLSQVAGTNSAGASKAANEIADDVWHNTTNAPVDVIYTITPFSAAGCAGDDFTVTVTINPEPIGVPQSPTRCSDELVNVTLGVTGASAAAATYNILVNANGLAFSGTTPSAGNGKAANELMDDKWTNTGLLPVVVTYTITPVTAATCLGDPFSVAVTVNPEPVGAAGTATRCSDEAVAFTLTTSGTAVAAATFDIVTNSNGLTQSAGTVSAGSGRLANELVDDVWTNVGLNPVNVVYTVTPYSGAGCAGNPFTVTITVRPIPVGATLLKTICSDVAVGVNLNTMLTGGAAAANFNITIDNAAGLTASAGAPANGNGLPATEIQNDKWTNLTGAPHDIVYHITPVAGGSPACAGVTFDLVVTVNPEPVVAAVPIQIFCPGEAVNIPLTSNVIGATISWTNSNPAVGIAFSGTGDIVYTAPANNTGADINATINITAESNGCTSAGANAKSFTLRIKPSPNVNLISDVTVCSGAPISTINFSANTGGGESYAWTNDNIGIGLPANGTTNINGYTAPINITGVPIVGNITVTATRLGCVGAPRTFKITINPEPVVTALPNISFCPGDPIVVAFASNVPGASISWTNTNTAIGIGASGLGDMSFAAPANNSGADIVGTINVIATANSCVSAGLNAKSFTITIKPSPVVNAVTNVTVCSGGTVPLITFGSNAGAGVTFDWLNDNTGIGLPGNGNGPIASFTAAINTTSTPFVANISVTGTKNSCSSVTPRVFTITVLPQPVGTPTPVTVCSDVAVGVNLSTYITGGAAAASYHIQIINPDGLVASGGSPVDGLNKPATEIQNDKWTNHTGIARDIIYRVTPVSGATPACAGDPFDLVVTIDPEPVVTSVTDKLYCPGETITIPLTSNVASATINWSNSNPGIGLAFTGTGSISATAPANNTGANIVGTITVSAEANGCVSAGTNIKTFQITIKPTPVVNTVTDITVCSGANIAAINFSANTGGGESFSWTNDNISIGLAASGIGGISSYTAPVNISGTPIVANIAVTATRLTCASSPMTFKITVNPEPVVAAIADQAFCAGDPINIAFTSNVAGATIAWTNDNTLVGIGATGSGDLSFAAGVNNTGADIVGNFVVTASRNGCTSTGLNRKLFKITIKPTPIVNAITDITVCSGGTVVVPAFGSNVGAGGVTVTWANDNTLTGLAANGSGDIATFTAGTNTTGGPITGTVTYFGTRLSCVGPSKTFRIIVLPQPVGIPTTVTVCSDAAVNVNLASLISGSAAMYNVSITNPFGLTASAGSPGNNNGVGPTEIQDDRWTNHSGSQQTITYRITPIGAGSPGCVGAQFDLTVNINPEPVVAPVALQEFCPATAQTIPLTSNVTGATISWTNNNPLIGLGFTGSGDISYTTPANNTGANITGTITVSASKDGCVSSGTNIKTFDIVIKPTPIINQVSNVVVCSGGAIPTINFTSNTGGSETYSWTNSNAGIGIGLSGTVNIPGYSAPVNTTGVPIIGNISVTAMRNGCPGPAMNFSITINPEPVVATIVSPLYCAGEAASIPLSSNVGGATINWTNSNTLIGLGASGTGSTISFTANTNNTGSDIVANMVVTATKDGCTSAGGNAKTFTITIKPTPVVTAITDITVCSGQTVNVPAFASNVVLGGVTFDWVNDNPSILLGPSGTGNITAFSAATNTSGVPMIANVTVTGTKNSCASLPVSFRIIVNPEPVVNTITNKSFCPADPVSIPLSSNVTGATISWTNSNAAIGLATTGGGDISFVAAANTTGVDVTSTIVVTADRNGCFSTGGNSKTFTITVKATPIVNPVTSIVVCSGDPIGAFNFASNADPGVTFNWTNDNTTIGLVASGTGNIPGFTAATNTGSVQMIANLTVTGSKNSCAGPAVAFTIKINPEPVIAPVSPTPICSREKTNITLGTNGISVNAQFYRIDAIDYSSNGGPFGAALPAGFTRGGLNPNVGTQGSTGHINADTYTNTSPFFVDVRYTITPISSVPCPGDAAQITIRVNPEPDLDDALNPADICSGETIVGANPGYLLRAEPTSVAATEFIIRSIDPGTAIPALSNTGVGDHKPANAINNDRWVNTGSSFTVVTYKIAPVTAAGCVGPDQDVQVRVNPSPSVKDGLDRVVCSGDESGIILQHNASGVMAGSYVIVTIVVDAGLTPGGSNAVASPTPTTDVDAIRHDRFVNTTNDRHVVTYTIRPIADAANNLCPGPDKVITLTVEPKPLSVSTNAKPTICSGEAVDITLNSPTYGALTNPVITFTYSATTGSVTGATAQSNVSELTKITDVLVNNTNAPITVTYHIRPRASAAANGSACDGDVEDVQVVVAPRPRINTIPNKTICEGTPVNLNLVSTTTPAAPGVIKIFVTSTPDPAITGNTNGSLVANNTVLGDVLVNSSASLKFVTYHLEVRTVDASDATICTAGAPIDVVVGVSPKPQITPIANFAICSGDSFDPIPIITDTETAVPGSTLVTWTVTPNANVSGESNGAGNTFSQVLFNTTADKQVVVYNLNATNINSSPTCLASPPTELRVTVYPNPKVVGLPSSANVCNNGTLSPNPYVLNASTVAALGTTFDWTVDNGGNPDLPAIANGVNQTAITQTFVNNGSFLGTQQYTITAHLNMQPSDNPLIDTSITDAVCTAQQDAVIVVNVAPPVNGDIYGFDIEGNQATEIYLCRGAKQFVYIDPVGLPLMEVSYRENGTTKTLTKLGGLNVLQVSPANTTTYELLTVKDKFGCVQTINKTVTVHVDEVDNNFNLVGPAIACSPFPVTFQHNQVAGTSYTWKWLDGPDSTTYLAGASEAGKLIKHTYTNPSPGSTAKFRASLDAFLDTTKYLAGCRKKPVIVEVKVHPTVSTAVFPDKDVICSDETIAFVNSSQGVTASGHRWFYRVAGSTTELDVKTTPNVTFKIPNTTTSNPLVYEVVYRATNGNCPAPEVVTPITVYRGVDAHFTNTDPTVFVGGHSFVTFTNDSQPVDKDDFRYEWDFGFDSKPETAVGIGPHNLDYIHPGPKEVKLTATNMLAEAAGLTCADTYTAIINIIVPPLIADFTAVPLQACFPTDITITENKATGDVFAWRVLDNAGTAGQSNLEKPVFKIPAPGKYTIELVTTNSYTGDQKTATKDVIIYNLPMASFDMRPGVVYVPDTEVLTYNFSDGATSYAWDFGDGSTSDEKEPTYKYRIEGVYDVTLIAMNDHGNGVVCADTLSRKITAKQGGVTRVPNAFTPNPNGPTSSNGTPGVPGSNTFNDVFLPQVKGAEEFNMQIFDRWGNLIFESNNSNVGWDGYDRNGRLMPMGVYVYKLTLRLSDGQRTTQVGDITMIR